MPLAVKTYFALCEIQKVTCICLTEETDWNYLSYEHDFLLNNSVEECLKKD